jgi:hypothetical protein
MFKFVKIIKTSKKNIITDNISKIFSSVKKLGTGYEVITDSCIPYYDFEREYNTEAERLANYKTDLDFAINALSIYSSYKILEFTACGYDNIKNKYKNSFHFRIRGFGYYSNNSQIQKIDGFDSEVYHLGSQLFRLPYASKEGQNRPLKRFNSKTGTIIELADITEKYEDYLVQNVEGEKLIEGIVVKTYEKGNEAQTCIASDLEIDDYIKKVTAEFPEMNNFRYKSHKTTDNSTIINFLRVRSSYCKICDRTHDTDNTFYLTVYPKSNKIFYGCNRTKSKPQYICKIDDTKIEVNTYKKSPNLPNTIFVNEQYCSNITQFTDAIKNGVSLLVLKSNMGTGKTYCAAESINKIDWIKSVGLVSFRVSLAEKYVDDFKGFACYNTKKERVIEDDKWICQADSLHRIKSTNPLDKLILDEVDQLRKHMTSTTFLNNSNFYANRASLKHIIKTAKQVIIMSANITQDDIDWIHSMRIKQESVVITNTYKPESRIINISAKEKVIESAKEDYKNNRRFVIAHNGSPASQETLKRFISKKDDILLINSEHMSDDNVKEVLKNPNINWCKYMGIIYSPSVQSGLSIDIKDTIHSIYGIFGNSSNSSNDISQMLNRVRHPISNEIMVSIDMYNFNNVKPTNKDDMIRYLKTSRSHIFNNTKDGSMNAILNRIPFEYSNYGELEFLESDILNEYCKNLTEHNLDSILYKKNFINLQIEYGNTIVFDETKGLKKTKTDMKEINVEVNLEIATEISEAPEITPTEAIELKKKIKNTPDLIKKEDITKIKKYNINNLYHIKGNSPEWYLKYGASATKNHYKNLSYFYKKNQSLQLSLEDLKKSECINDILSRIDENDEAKSTEICIVSSILTKPKYQKYRVLIDWLDTLGFDKLDSNIEINQEDLKANLAIILNNFTDKDFDCLEKNKRNLESIKKLKPSDPRFIGNLLKFINGALLTEFNIKVNKKSKHSNMYVLFNDYISDTTFLNPYNSDIIESHVPILGSIKDKNIINTNTTDEPYDSDDED